MLADPQAFARAEEFLKQNGTIAAFEARKGPITGRMMIDKGAVPLTLLQKVDPDAHTAVFRGTFDFSKTACGVAIDTLTLKPKTAVWTEEQALGAYQLDKRWVDYFLEVLRDGLEGGIDCIPIFGFMSEQGSFEVYPG